ncbi:Translation elongation factor P Lys34--(R)-beta-lysine ligase [hydrothermal vent metagenome]|uniref:Translation elongation factor P Lys34--(R)-beta-lysine ligase n=1 Tax=hydrothermal vent metagenome TaxID=652676 RepID=A0A3B0YZS0_9ZZZZ
MWRPSASIEALKFRAQANKIIRHFFAVRDIMEVETPILSHFATTDPFIESFSCDIQVGTKKLGEKSKAYLHTSPEFAMKRLVAAGAGPIFQLCKVFRQEELGRWHNPEFTLLEWYRPGLSYHQLIDETAELIQNLLVNSYPLLQPYDANLLELVVTDNLQPDNQAQTHKQSLLPVIKISYADLFKQHIGVDPHLANVKLLASLVKKVGINLSIELNDLDKDSCLQLLLTHIIEPAMPKQKLVFIYDYPSSQASLAQLDRRDNYQVAQRFECFFNGVELANGFQELTSATEQQQRFEQNNSHRADKNLRVYPFDQLLIDSMQSSDGHDGLPDTAGVAVGVDRVLVFALEMSGCQVPNKDKNSLSSVLAFNFERA